MRTKLYKHFLHRLAIGFASPPCPSGRSLCDLAQMRRVYMCVRRQRYRTLPPPHINEPTPCALRVNAWSSRVCPPTTTTTIHSQTITHLVGGSAGCIRRALACFRNDTGDRGGRWLPPGAAGPPTALNGCRDRLRDGAGSRAQFGQGHGGSLRGLRCLCRRRPAHVQSTLGGRSGGDGRRSNGVSGGSGGSAAEGDGACGRR